MTPKEKLKEEFEQYFGDCDPWEDELSVMLSKIFDWFAERTVPIEEVREAMEDIMQENIATNARRELQRMDFTSINI